LWKSNLVDNEEADASVENPKKVSDKPEPLQREALKKKTDEKVSV
jgi:hypothetical protein